MSTSNETIEGYVVDLACLRTYPQSELLERARVHTSSCTLMGHCVESGYGLVDEQGRLTLLDPGATPKVVAAVRASDKDRGVKLQARREMQGGRMQTTDIEEA